MLFNAWLMCDSHVSSIYHALLLQCDAPAYLKRPIGSRGDLYRLFAIDLQIHLIGFLRRAAH